MAKSRYYSNRQRYESGEEDFFKRMPNSLKGKQPFVEVVKEEGTRGYGSKGNMSNSNEPRSFFMSWIVQKEKEDLMERNAIGVLKEFSNINKVKVGKSTFPERLTESQEPVSIRWIVQHLGLKPEVNFSKLDGDRPARNSEARNQVVSDMMGLENEGGKGSWTHKPRAKPLRTPVSNACVRIEKNMICNQISNSNSSSSDIESDRRIEKGHSSASSGNSGVGLMLLRPNNSSDPKVVTTVRSGKVKGMMGWLVDRVDSEEDSLDNSNNKKNNGSSSEASSDTESSKENDLRTLASHNSRQDQADLGRQYAPNNIATIKPRGKGKGKVPSVKTYPMTTRRSRPNPEVNKSRVLHNQGKIVVRNLGDEIAKVVEKGVALGLIVTTGIRNGKSRKVDQTNQGNCEAKMGEKKNWDLEDEVTKVVETGTGSLVF
ncbi:hypothetical protein Q3G72_019865 [Acer saccharum]|nr:hypothetical protein Q3G72_019865 [Acer saccharum]